MKKFTIIILSLCLLCWPTLSSNSEYSNLSENEILLLQPQIDKILAKIDSIKNADYVALMNEIRKALNQVEIAEFMTKLAHRESSGDWKIVNRFGYVGKYQFGLAARKSVNAPKFTVKEFISNPNIWPEKQQDTAAFKLMKLNYGYLNKFFNQPGDKLETFFNKTFVLGDKTKVRVTLAGMIAASHLVGPKSVRQFLNTRGGIDKKDGNGTKCSDYMRHFQKYDMVLTSQ